MKFLLTMSAYSISPDEKEKYEKLGFEFEEIKTQLFCGRYRRLKEKVYIEIETLEELIKFKNEYGNEIVLRTDGEDENIEVYNDYRE